MRYINNSPSYFIISSIMPRSFISDSTLHHLRPPLTAYDHQRPCCTSSLHLLLYKWAPITSTQNNGNGKMIDGGDNDEEPDNKSSSKDDSIADEEPRKRKFKYIPVAVSEDQLNEASKQDEYDAKADDMETDQDGSKPTPKRDTVENMDEKPDINDVPTDVDQIGLIHNTTRQVWRAPRGLPDASVAVFHSWIFEHFLNPYPTDYEKLICLSSQMDDKFSSSSQKIWSHKVFFTIEGSS